MKSITAIAVVILAPLVASAQDVAHLPAGLSIDRGFITGLATILFAYLGCAFILATIRSIQDYRLRSKLVEKGVPANIVEQFLQPTKRDAKMQAMKWFLVLAGIGLALTIIHFTPPMGFHSVAIMAFCISFSFLAYYYFIRKTEK